jgi:hypothetical protein
MYKKQFAVTFAPAVLFVSLALAASDGADRSPAGAALTMGVNIAPFTMVK